MKSKVILFSVLLFCSKIVDSIPQSEDLVRQRVNPLSNWQVNQNAPNAQYLDTDVTQTHENVNIQQEKNPDYYSNQGRYNFDSNGYNRIPASSLSGEELLVSYGSPAVGRNLDSYPPRVESYPSRTSQVGFDNQQYRNQNWRSQNQYANSAPIAVLIPDDERPLVTTVQEPYRGPVQYLQPKYVPSSNRRFYQPGRSYLTREQLQYPLTGDSKYVANSAPRFGSSGAVPYESNSEDQVAASEIKARPPGGRRYRHNITPQSGISYNDAPAVIATETLTDQYKNIEYAKNYRSRSDLSNTAPVTNYDNSSPVISETDNYGSDSKPSNDPVPYESYREGQAAASEVKARPIGGRRYVQSLVPRSGIIDKVVATDTLTDPSENIKYLENYKSHSHLSNTAPIINHDDGFPSISEEDNNNSDSLPSNLAHVNSKKEAPVVINKILSDSPPPRRYANNKRSDSRWSNIARDDSSNGTPVVTETVEVKSKKHEANYGPKEPVPITTYTEASSAPTDTELLNSGNNKYDESNVAHHGSSSSAPLNTNPKENMYLKLTSGLTEFNLKSLVANPDIQNMLAGSNKRYLVVHPNGTVEHLDKLDLDSHQNSKLRLVHTKRKNIDDSDSDGVLTQQSPENLPNNIAKTPAPVDEYPLPTNNQPADDKKRVDQANPADEYDSNLSPPMKDLPADPSNLKPLSQPEKQPADNKNSNPSYVIPPAEDDNSMPLTPNEGQSAQNDNLKPLPQDVNQPGDEDDSKPLTPHVNQLDVDRYSKSLPQDGNQPAGGDNSKLLTSKEDQPADDDYSKLDQPEDENNFTTLSPNARQRAHVKKTKHSYIKHPANDNNSKPLPTNKNQPDDDRPFHPYRRQPAHNSNPSSPDEDQPRNDNNFKPLPSDENQSGDGNDSEPNGPNKLHNNNNNKSKYSHVNQPTDDDNTLPLTSNEEQPGDDKKSKPLPVSATQSANDTKSKPSLGDQSANDNNSKPSSPDKNQPKENKKSKPLRPNENQPTYDLKSNQPTDDLKSKPTPAVASENDDQSNSTTVSPTVPNYTTSSEPQVIKPHKHTHRKSTTNSPVVSTTTSPDETLEDQIITLSPIEQATNNVRNVPPVTTTTTTASSVEAPGKSDTINDANNKQDDAQDGTSASSKNFDNAQTYSTTTLSPSSSASPTDNINNRKDDKTIGTIKNKNTQTNDKTVVDQINNGKKDTAVYNSSELFDTKTEVPAESDDYSSVTASASVQNDVNTGDASGDNSLELGQSETDVTITASSSTANDSEDEIITINIEVSESTDDADSSSNDKSVVVSIDTNDDSGDDAKSPKPEDCKKDHNSDVGRGKNIEIDVSNLKGEPTMWIRTTNQDFIDKLTAKNDTAFDVIYFFHIDNQPTIEREKATTIHCNGTVVIETKEITYEHKDDPTPAIVRTTKIMQIEDYEAE